MYGYRGKILRVDLTKMKAEAEEVKTETYKMFLGGTGLATKIIFDEVYPEIEPLSSENRLIFAVGPFQGINIPGSGRWTVATRSPLTNIWGEANAGGAWGPELKKAGFDAIVIQGGADKPVYLWIYDGNVEIKDASSFWNMDSYETHDAIKKDLGEERAKVAAIGQAGENMVKFACIMSDKHAFAGRTGVGAVMGSKKLKAIAVLGTEKIEVSDPDRLEDIVKELTKELVENAKSLSEHGTPFYMPVGYDEIGDVPLKYWSEGKWTEGIIRLGAPMYTETIFVKREPCLYCPVGCHRYVRVEKPEKYACEGSGPEYETIAMMGSICLIDNLPAVAKMNDLCNRYGLDTISTGALIAFAMECYERKLITSKDTDGIELTWGDADAAIAMVEKIARKEGFGAVLADGIKAAAQRIGKGAENFAQHVKGLDFPAHDPRAFMPMALNYATGNRGACHERGAVLDAYFEITIPEIGLKDIPSRESWEGQALVTARFQDWACIFDSLIQCKFTTSGVKVSDQVNLLNAVTGWDITAEELMKMGERIFNLQRMFNVKMGISRKDDTLPARMFKAAHPQRHVIPILEPMLNEYYRLRGWQPDGKPSREKLRELDLI